MNRIRLFAALLPCLCLLAAGTSRADDPVLRELTDLAAPANWVISGSPGMVLVLVRGQETFIGGYGETTKGNGQEPNGRSLFRLGSISKVLATELLADLVVDGKARLGDTLQQFAPADMTVPSAGGRAITLLDLATHSAGLPREIGPIPADEAPRTWPSREQRWAFLAGYKLPWAPGTIAAYSNVGFQLLGDALQSASGEDYPSLLRHRITEPLGMADTGVQPTADQCSRLMTGSGLGGPGPCVDTIPTAASGGVYSTGDDMAKWLRHRIAEDAASRSALALTRATYRQRQEMPAVIGFDEAGPMAGLGLGWVISEAQGNAPMIVQKSGAAAGFMSYVAFVPGRQVGVFVVVNRLDFAIFHGLTTGANAMLAELAPR